MAKFLRDDLIQVLKGKTVFRVVRCDPKYLVARPIDGRGITRVFLAADCHLVDNNPEILTQETALYENEEELMNLPYTAPADEERTEEVSNHTLEADPVITRLVVKAVWEPITVDWARVACMFMLHPNGRPLSLTPPSGVRVSRNRTADQDEDVLGVIMAVIARFTGSHLLDRVSLRTNNTSGWACQVNVTLTTRVATVLVPKEDGTVAVWAL